MPKLNSRQRSALVNIREGRVDMVRCIHGRRCIYGPSHPASVRAVMFRGLATWDGDGKAAVAVLTDAGRDALNQLTS